MNITFMSFNTQHCLNYLEQKIDFDIMVDAIKKCDADIIGLNEMHGLGTNEEYTDQTKTLADKLGYPYYYFAQATYIDDEGPFGNSIISRYPIISTENIPVPDPEIQTGDDWYETRCLLKAKIDVGVGVTVCVIHFGLNRDEALNAQKVVVDNIENRKCVLMGDFNLEPDSDILVPIREKLFDTADLFKTELLSFPSDEPIKKIDYIFTSKDMNVISADIPEIVAADHRPHIAVIDL